MLPTQVLFLLTHEFQHKARFRGAFVNDNDPIGPFANGRDLIDNAAKSVVAIARRTGKIGFQFGIRDIFDCIVLAGSARFGARLSSSRLFLAADLFSYETSLGHNTSFESIFLPETIDTAVVFKFRIQEPNNCGDPHPSRKTSVQIVRRSKISNRAFQDTVLSEVELQHNPMCPQSDPKIELSWQQTTFSCQYFGSQGSSSSIYSNRPRPQSQAPRAKSSM